MIVRDGWSKPRCGRGRGAADAGIGAEAFHSLARAEPCAGAGRSPSLPNLDACAVASALEKAVADRLLGSPRGGSHGGKVVPMHRGLHVAVVGSGSAEREHLLLAEDVGRLLAGRGIIVVCGGLGGVMEAVCRGAKSAGGMTVGILPGLDRSEANPWVDVAIPTGLGEARNALVVRTADVLIAIGGEYGTLSEIALAVKTGKPVVGIDTWELSRSGVARRDIVQAATAAEAVEQALRLVRNHS